MAYKMNQEYLESKKISLFKGTDGYKDGEQKRDFIYIDDVVDIIRWLIENIVLPPLLCITQTEKRYLSNAWCNAFCCGLGVYGIVIVFNDM